MSVRRHTDYELALAFLVGVCLGILVYHFVRMCPP